jgi:hypothetical protein
MGTKFLPLLRCITSKRLVVLCVALLAMAITAVPASAQGGNCLQNEYNVFNGAAAGSTSNSLALNCTANDVRIAQVTNIRDPLTGATLSTCFQGTTFSFIADFEILTTSSQARENIGLYIATDSRTQALTGSCVDNIISPQHACSGTTTNPPIQCGSDNYHSTDPAPDNCGDTSSGDFSNTFGAGAEKVTLRIDNFSCTAPAGSTTLVLPNCTSWQIPGGTNQCVSPSPSFPYEIAAVPGTKSKCNCEVISIPITPVTVAPIVQKACTTNNTPGPAVFTQTPTVTQSPTSCDAGAEGSTVTYTVAITNTSNVSGNNVVVDQICDNRYGNVFTASGFTPACAAGTVGTVSSSSCPPSPIAPGATGTCTFTAVQGEIKTVTDTVSASGHSSVNASSVFTNTQSNSVTVTSTDAPSTATVTKGVDSTIAACATVRYTVDVHNTSGADEVLTLSAFNDSAYGSITSVQGSVLGTTCGVATGSAGLGTLSGSPGAGALSTTIAIDGHYQCKFDAQFCSALDNNSCISHSNKVSGTLLGDESEAVTQTGNTLTVKECVTSSTSSTTP